MPLFGNPVTECGICLTIGGTYQTQKIPSLKKGGITQESSLTHHCNLAAEIISKKELNNLRKIKSEIVTLENSLSLDPRLQFHPEIARVSLRNISSWSQIFEVNKGSNFKITHRCRSNLFLWYRWSNKESHKSLCHR